MWVTHSSWCDALPKTLSTFKFRQKNKNAASPDASYTNVLYFTSDLYALCTLQASWCINSSSSYFLIELEEKVCDLKTCYNMRCIFNLLRTVFAMSHVLCLLSRNKCCWLRRCRKHNPWENTQIDKSVLLVTKIYLHCRSLLVNVSILLQGKPVFVTSTQRSMDGEEFS